MRRSGDRFDEAQLDARQAGRRPRVGRVLGSADVARGGCHRRYPDRTVAAGKLLPATVRLRLAPRIRGGGVVLVRVEVRRHVFPPLKSSVPTAMVPEGGGNGQTL